MSVRTQVGRRRGWRGWGVVVCACVAAAASGWGCAGKGRGYEEPAALSMGDPAQRLAEAKHYAGMARRAEDAGRWADAISAYQKALEAYPDFGAVWHNLGVVLMKEQRFMEAQDAFFRAGDLMPTDPRPMFMLGYLWEDRGYLDEAMQFYNKALARDENSVPGLRGAIRIVHRLHVVDERANDRLRRAIMLDPDPQWQALYAREQIRLRQALRDQQETFTP